MTAAFSPPENDNANVNLTRLGDRYIAMTELPVPVEFDRETLDTVGPMKWKDRVGGSVGSAHPHHDAEADELVSYVVDFSARSTYKLFAVPAGSDERRLIAKIPAGREPSYLHSIAMTERFLVVVAWPTVMDPLRLIRKGGGFMDSMSWKPERGTKFHVVDRHSGEHVATGEGEPFFCFHHINAYEEGDEVVVDLCAYEDPSVIEALELSHLRAGDKPPQAFPTRYRVPLAGGAVQGERLSDESLELPRIDYGRRNGRPYRYVWGAGSSEWLGPGGQARRGVAHDPQLAGGGLLPRRAGVRPPPRRGGRGRRRAALPGARRRRGPFLPRRARRGDARGAGPGRGPARDPVRLPRPVLPVT